MTLDLRLGSYADVLTDQVNSIDLHLYLAAVQHRQQVPQNLMAARKAGKYDPKSYGGITGYADSLPEDTYQDQQVDFLRWCVTALKEDGVLVYNHKPRRKNCCDDSPYAVAAASSRPRADGGDRLGSSLHAQPR